MTDGNLEQARRHQKANYRIVEEVLQLSNRRPQLPDRVILKAPLIFITLV